MFSLLLQEIISEIIQIVLKFSFNKIKENIKEDKIERPKEARLEKIEKPKEEKTAEKKITCQDTTSFTCVEEFIKTCVEEFIKTCVEEFIKTCVEEFIKTCFEDVRNENPQYRFIYLILQNSLDRIDYVNVRLVNALNNNCLDFSMTKLYFTPINEDSKIYIKIRLRNICEQLI